jgi:Methyltransferase FkbM domain
VTALIKLHDCSSIDILKMDIEGAERQVFSGECGSWIARTRVMIVELHDRTWPGCADSLNNATKEFCFLRTERGENTILINQGFPPD